MTRKTDACESTEERRTILVVDDESDIREVLRLMLSADGYRVLTAEDGQRAIEIARSFRVDLLITDLKMPGMSGIETARRIRRIVADLPVIVMSGYVTFAGEGRGRAPLDDVLLVRKPFEYDELSAAVTAALGSD